MNSRGHVGLALLATSLASFPLSCTYNPKVLAALALLVSFAAPLPDIDLALPRLKHRGVTHTLLFTLAVPLAASTPLCLYSLAACAPVALLLAVSLTSHLVGDAMTVRGVEPLRPFSRVRLALGLFRADNETANTLAAIAGAAALTGYVVAAFKGLACGYAAPATLALAVLLALPALGARRRRR